MRGEGSGALPMRGSRGAVCACLAVLALAGCGGAGDDADAAGAELEYNEARARWLRYQDQILPQSTKVRESVAFAYEKGGASLLNLLEAERTDNDVRMATAQAAADTAAALADLIAARMALSKTELHNRN